ncbi:hypothetical protein DL764_002587 [Monosporascus ibericus]|uniref:Uncharacterized protein n=1 Tax=Monosporascus ibericus TaxID=155417 RepID=A0A4Q4TLG4_9PEZI|nr:hypothetical protein DL764_002587 [Monosporascus ibericus]
MGQNTCNRGSQRQSSTPPPPSSQHKSSKTTAKDQVDDTNNGDHISVHPPLSTRQQETTSSFQQQAATSSFQQPAATSSFQQPATTSTFQQPGPGFNHQITNYPGGLSYSTLPVANPPVGVVPQVQTPGLFNYTTPYTCSTTPYYYYYYPVSTRSNMSEYQDPRIQPPGAQNFTDNPETGVTNGPMVHQWTPRFDGQYAMNSGPGFQPVPVFAAPGVAGAVPLQQVPMPQVQPCQPPFAAQFTLPAQPVPIAQQVLQQATYQASYYPWNASVAAQPMPMPAMMYPGQQQQSFVFQPGQPMPPAQVVGQAPQFVGQPTGFAAPAAQVPPPPGIFQQVGHGMAVPGQPMPGMPTFPPDIMGIGKTSAEMAMEQAHAAVNNQANEPQDFQPADPDPGRMYWVRQLDNEWIQMSRFTIDRLACRWFIWPNGVFYAVRLED